MITWVDLLIAMSVWIFLDIIKLVNAVKHYDDKRGIEAVRDILLISVFSLLLFILMGVNTIK